MTVKRRADGGRLRQREDYALVHVPASAGAPGTPSLFSVVLGIPSALVFFAVGGALERAYGTVPVVMGLLVAALIIGLAGWKLTAFAVRSGLDSDLMSIPVGFGVRGSALTSLIYSANFVVLFALEDNIMANAIHGRYPAIPRSAVLVGAGVAVLFLTWRGVASLARTMNATLPLFIGLMVFAIVQTNGHPNPAGSFWSYRPPGVHLDATAWLSVLAALLAFIVNATVAADVGRFLAPKRAKAGPALFGLALQVVSFGGATLLGAWFGWRLLGSADPGVFLPTLLGGWGVACVLLSQVRINLINAYSGSLSLSNFAARLVGLRPGRHIWMIVLVAGSTLLALTSIYGHLLGVLTFEAVFVMAWVWTLITYMVCFQPDATRSANERLDAFPNFNFVGIAGLTVTLAVAVPLAFGVGGNTGKALAPVAALITAPVGVLIGAGVRSWRSGAHSKRFATNK